MAAFERQEWRKSAAPAAPAAVPQRRTHRRVTINLPTRFALPDGKSREGVLLNLSLRGAFVVARPAAIPGDRVTLLVPDLGKLSGRVVRISERGFGLVLGGGKPERVARADLLTLFLNRKHADATRAIRYPTAEESVLETVTGQVAHCIILDVSTSGAQIATSLFPALGETVMVGRKRGVVIRHFEDGIGIAFRPSGPQG